jgi:putative SOS response-associated peptidase YedK
VVGKPEIGHRSCNNESVCNRFRSTRSDRYLAERFQAWDEIDYQPRFNVAPTQPIVTVRQESDKRKMEMTRWGLIPSRASGISAGHFNARSESVTSTPSFRELIHTHRCLIPADGFYEWQQMGSVKQPYCFEVGAGDVFAFAGLWDEWQNPSGEVIKSCAILTTNANALVADIHDRMPVIVSPDHYELWLRSGSVNLDAVLRPYDASAMRRYPVSTRLNNSENDDPECAKPIVIDVPAQAQLF